MSGGSASDAGKKLLSLTACITDSLSRFYPFDTPVAWVRQPMTGTQKVRVEVPKPGVVVEALQTTYESANLCRSKKLFHERIVRSRQK